MADSPRFLLDLEIDDLHTVDHDSLAESILEAIRLAPAPFRIALFGPWGSGKSTILKMVNDRVGKEHHAGTEEGLYCRAVWFNAWHYESDPNLLASLMASLVHEIPDGVRYSRKGTKTVRDVLRAADWLGRRHSEIRNAPLSSGQPDDDHGDVARVKSMRDAVRRFIDLTLVQGPKSRPRRLVVFVDDLDKCQPENVLTLLEALKLFFDPGTNIVVVFALDRTVLRSAIERKYDNDLRFDTEQYVEKIFEFSFDVPPIKIRQLEPLVGELFERAGLEGIANGSDLQALENTLCRQGLVLSPRKIKRIFNKFVWFFHSRQRLLSQAEAMTDVLPPERELTTGGSFEVDALEEVDLPEIDVPQLWLSWLLLTEYWRDFRDFVGEHQDAAVGELCNRVTGNLLYPHANQRARERFDDLTHRSSLQEYFRPIFNAGGAAHLPGVQRRMRTLVAELLCIDRVLRANGI